MKQPANNFAGSGQTNWLMIQELADRWRIGYETVRTQIISGKIPSIQIGSTRRISLKWVQKFEAEADKPTDKEMSKALREVRRSLSCVSSGKDHFPDL